MSCTDEVFGKGKVDHERHRQLYVACTRARISTTSI